MKFGKHLQKRQLDIPEYAAKFVNYKALKKLIKKLSHTPVLQPQNGPPPPPQPTAPAGLRDPQASLQARKATFFFHLERELEKVNTFYLQKEAELEMRLKTLLDKKRVMQARSETASKTSANFITLEEGFQQFIGDLNKLQQYVEINATAFSKILKKWDKTSKSRTKELYLSRAVEVQPCFNRDVITELSDQATTGLLELGAWAEGEKVHYPRSAEHVIGPTPGTDDNDTDVQLLHAVTAGNLSALRDWIERLRQSTDARERLTRTFLAAINDAPEESLALLLTTDLVDIHAEDEINERNCLHEAVISGRDFVLRAGLERKVDVARADVYGRLPLHYACTHGRVEMLQTLLATGPDTLDALDHDNFTPLIHAIVHHQVACVEQLLLRDARIDPTWEADHVPLNMACQQGAIEPVRLLLQKRARILPDAEGLCPQHLVARSGRSPELLLLLKEFGANLDETDRLMQWTPLFHAASEGHVACLKALLEADVRLDVLDEKELSAMYYAAWEGHLECMQLLAAAGATSGIVRPSLASQPRLGSLPASREPERDEVSGAPVDADGIPDLSLPPPIIPLRRYGHNFLDSKTLVQIGFGEAGSDAIAFYHDSKYPAARLTISSKHSDLIPRNVLLPMQEEARLMSFQISNLDVFTIDFDIFPTFGSKVIAKTVALSSLFQADADLGHSSAGHCCLPLFDPRLRAIGQIAFDFQVIRPFPGPALEISDFATYWKATSQFDFHPTALITGSSLSGEYVRLFVQLTADLVPVLYPRWTVTHAGIEYPIGRLTYAQFVDVGGQAEQRSSILAGLRRASPSAGSAQHRLLASSFLTLKEALANLDPNVHVDLQVLYPTASEEKRQRVSPTANINVLVDAILRDVFDHARDVRTESPDFMRSIIFSSYNASVCTALNWKQPNYPVFLCNDLGREDEEEQESSKPDVAAVVSSGRGSMSVKEAVRIAQTNNFMGLVCSSRLLEMVPALIESIKVAGLVLVRDLTGLPVPGPTPPNIAGPPDPDDVDGVLRGNGVLTFHETIDL